MLDQIFNSGYSSNAGTSVQKGGGGILQAAEVEVEVKH
jgi:hypothetical protein